MAQCRRRLSTFALVMICAVLMGACDTRRTSVEGKLTLALADGTAVSRSQHLVHDENPARQRIVYGFQPGAERVTAAALELRQRRGEPYPARYLLIALNPRAEPPNGTSLSGAPGWAAAHLGGYGLGWIDPDPAGAASVALPIPPTVAGHTGAGAAWVIRLEDDDPLWPWRIDAGTGCWEVPASASYYARADTGATDCFDVETLAASLLGQLAVTVAEGIAAASGRDGVVLHVDGHRISFVPALDIDAERQSGVAFIYEADIRARAGIAVAGAVLRLPLQLVIETPLAASAQPVVNIVPIERREAYADLAARLSVDYGAPPSAPFMNQMLADGLLNSIEDTLATLEPAMVDTAFGPRPLGEAISLQFGISAGAAGWPSDAAYALLPTGLTPAQGDTVLFRTVTSVVRESGDAVSLDRDLAGVQEVSVRTDGKIARTTYFDSNGKDRRVVVLDRLQAGAEVDLWLLR
jgi:hypothetical protein